MSEIKVIDTTLRDAHQCLWATRMTTAMMLPVADAMDRCGFEAIDLMSAIQFDVCVRYLKEDPWQRLRLMRERVTRTKMQSAMRSKSAEYITKAEKLGHLLSLPQGPDRDAAGE